MKMSGNPSLSKSEYPAPSSILCFDTQPRAYRDVSEVSFTLVVIKARHVTLKVRLDDVQLAVQKVVLHSIPSAGLFMAILAEPRGRAASLLR